MPINKIVATKRGKAAIAGVLATAIAGGYGTWNAQTRTIAVPDMRELYPVAVVLATEKLIKPWEGLVLKSHWDRFAKIYDIGYGETLINGKPVPSGLTITEKQAENMLMRRVYEDYYLPIANCAPNLKNAPDSVKASMISGAYNFGVGRRGGKGWCGSSMALKIDAGEWRAACEAQTAYNKAGIGEERRIVDGLVKRREMGDAQRIGEAELCVSGL